MEDPVSVESSVSASQVAESSRPVSFRGKSVSPSDSGGHRTQDKRRNRHSRAPSYCAELVKSNGPAVATGTGNEPDGSRAPRSSKESQTRAVDMCGVNEVVELVIGGHIFFASESTLRRSKTLQQLLQKVSVKQSQGSGESCKTGNRVPESECNQLSSCFSEGGYSLADLSATAEPGPTTSPSVRSVFVDRDPYRFSFVLDYLRNGQLDVRETSDGQKVYREALALGNPSGGTGDFSGNVHYRGCRVGDSDEKRDGAFNSACLSLVSLRCEFDYFGIDWPSRCLRCEVLFDPSRCQQLSADSVDPSGYALGLQHDVSDNDPSASAVGQTSSTSAAFPPARGDGGPEVKCYYHPGELIEIDLSSSECGDTGARKKALERQRAERRKLLYYTCCNRREDAIGCQAGAHLSEEEALARALRRRSPPTASCGAHEDGGRLLRTAAASTGDLGCDKSVLETETVECGGESETAKQVAVQQSIAVAMSACETAAFRRMQKEHGACFSPEDGANCGSGHADGQWRAPARCDSTLRCDAAEKREAGAPEPQNSWPSGAKSSPSNPESSLCRADSLSCSGADFAGGSPYAASGLQMPQYPGASVCSTSSPGVGYPLTVQYSQQTAQGAAVWSGGPDASPPSSVSADPQHGGFPGAYLPAYSVGVARPERTSPGANNSASMTLYSQPAAPRYQIGSSVPPLVSSSWACPFYYVPGPSVPPSSAHGVTNLLLAPHQSQSEPAQLLHHQMNAQQASLYAWEAIAASGAPMQAAKPHDSRVVCGLAAAPKKPAGGAFFCPWQEPPSEALSQGASTAGCSWPQEQHGHHQQCLVQEPQFLHLPFQQPHDVPSMPSAVRTSQATPPEAAARSEVVEQLGDSPRLHDAERQRRTGEIAPREGDTDEKGRSLQSDPEGERDTSRRPLSSMDSSEEMGSESPAGAGGGAAKSAGESHGLSLTQGGASPGAGGLGGESRSDASHSSSRRRRTGRAGASKRHQANACTSEGREESQGQLDYQAETCVVSQEDYGLPAEASEPCCQKRLEETRTPSCESPTARKKEVDVLCRDKKQGTNRPGRTNRRTPDCAVFGSWQSTDIEDTPTLDCGATAAGDAPDKSLTVEVFQNQHERCTCEAADASAWDRICSAGGLESPLASRCTRVTNAEDECCGFPDSGIGCNQVSASAAAPKGACSAHGSGASGKGSCAMNPLFKTKMCPLLKAGLCPKTARRCKFAHALQELRPTAEFYKTQMCSFWMMGFCRAGISCRHAHGEDELKVRPIGESRPLVEGRKVGDRRLPASNDALETSANSTSQLRP
ncbi:zinc finger (CCCH type) motif-containing protein [Toxoplasma gondii VAND]|uniref:Zinc finger (CCCH type) motif-containing protein n=1 Tax=Toxoplasma gondii VAND TaxID=933077 RepID=A0A086Q3E3_TOXGO|nr:zinc finger (CCCH type) motif-containing protein [Toxoplasma gondii VAND]